MRVVIAPNSFKGSLTANEAAQAIAAGWKAARPQDELHCVPIADGGEGTVEALVCATGGTYTKILVCGPLGEKIIARYAWLGGERQHKTAAIEMAAAAGLNLLSKEQRNPMLASSYGVGELLLHAAKSGADEILLGLGGSASNDGGAGMAQALGWRLLDMHGNELPPGGGALIHLAKILRNKNDCLSENCKIRALCDVDNPLCGPQGASAVYGPQKGASPEQVAKLDTALAHFAALIERDLGVDIRNIPGAGAAGGLGAGLLAFTNARLCPGFASIAEHISLAEVMRGAGIVITGEGRMDGQTLNGKGPLGVARLARENGVNRVYAFAGQINTDHFPQLLSIFDECIASAQDDSEDAMRNAAHLLQTSAKKFAAGITQA